MSGGELVRLVRLDRLPPSTTVEASAAECAALSERFGLPAVHTLAAEVQFTPHGDAVDARGRIIASFEQRCAVSDEPFANTLEEPIAFRFVAALAPHGEAEEIEFAKDAPDEIEYAGASFDLGEAVAQSFGLALDPYAEGPNADTVRRETGLSDEDTPSGPFSALASLKKD